LRFLKQNIFFWLFLALICFGLGRLFSYLEQNSINKRKITDGIQLEVQSKVEESRKLLNSFITNNPEKSLIKNISFYNSLYNRKGIVLLAYINDSLKVWTDNRVPVSETYVPDQFYKPCVKLGNGWYVVLKQNVNKVRGIALILIKQEYPYQNSYLQNTFHPDFNIDPNNVLGIADVVTSYNVKFKTGEFCFGLQYFHVSGYNETFNFIAFVFSLLAVLISSIVFIRLYKQFSSKQSPIFVLWASILILVLARWLMLHYKIPVSIYELPIFNPIYYAYNNLFPSLGDFLLNAFFYALIAFEFRKHYPALLKYNTVNILLLRIALLGILLLINVYYIEKITGGFIENSSLSFNLTNIFELSSYSYLAMVGVFVLFFGLYLLIEVFIEVLNYVNHREQITFLISFSVLIFVFFITLNISQGLSIVVFSFLPLFIWYWRTKKKMGYTLIYLFIIVGVFSIAFSNRVRNEVVKKESNNRRILAERLSAETDPVLEQLFSLFEKDLATDSLLQKVVLIRKEKNQQLFETKKLMLQKYFTGYWEKYDVNFFIYNRQGDPVLETMYTPNNDISVFENNLTKNKKVVTTKYLFHLKNDNGRIAYMARLPVKTKRYNKILGYNYVLIEAKYLSDDIGFPELLLNKKDADNQRFQGYSYAKYKNYNLISRFGDFSYPLTSASFTKLDNAEYEIEKEGYIHYIAQLENNSQIIVSTMLRNDLFAINIFSALLIFFLLCVFILFAIIQLRNPQKFFSVTLRGRIQLQLLLVLLFSFFILGYGSISSFNEQFKRQSINEVSNKTRAILIEVEEKLSNERNLKNFSNEYLNYLLSRLANTFSTDINIFDKNGNLVASSKVQLYQQKLTSTKINTEAYFYLANQEKTEYLHEERIGNLQYLSSYVPLRNKQNKILGYLNLPYFSKQSQLENEISSFLISLINIYLVLFALSIFTSLVISNRITYPLVLLREKIGGVKLGKSNELIVWEGKDEIANLVNEYNRMVVELMNSAEQLAKSEREGAWKEMAKQVAHEIKNPLTPMKLSVQLLERSWNDQHPDFENKLKRFTQTLIEQIDTLSGIATEFSNFAKMPTPSFDDINVKEIISASVNLFKDTPNIIFKTELPEGAVFIRGDKDYLLRIVNNLIKNSIQAIPTERTGKIEVFVAKTSELISIKISDNGKGIEEEYKSRIFNPNFTTKTTGTGLGLAMVKNMVEIMSGRIDFKSEVNVGTEFYIQFPIL
jgi:two-component system nitrogen regulation sensor histidine kinase NtrY